MPTKEFDIYDFWADYEPIQDTKKTSLIVCNHTSYFDMWVLLMIQENPSFLSKSSVAKIPIVGFFAKMHQTIFLNRADRKEKSKILEKIEEKANLAAEGKVQPLLIFPEGTTTNGRGMMKWKRGAFVCEKPLGLYSLYYDSKFIPCLNLTAPLPSAIITLSQFHNKLTYLRFKQPIDPLWILKKHGLKPGQEDNWEVIAQEVKELMCFAFDLINDDSSFKDKCAFDCEAQNLTMEQLMKRSS